MVPDRSPCIILGNVVIAMAIMVADIADCPPWKVQITGAKVGRLQLASEMISSARVTAKKFSGEASKAMEATDTFAKPMLSRMSTNPERAKSEGMDRIALGARPNERTNERTNERRASAGGGWPRPAEL